MSELSPIENNGIVANQNTQSVNEGVNEAVVQNQEEVLFNTNETAVFSNEEVLKKQNADSMEEILGSPELKALSDIANEEEVSHKDDTEKEIFNADGTVNPENLIDSYLSSSNVADIDALLNRFIESGNVNPDDISYDENGQSRVGNFDDAGNGSFSLVDGTEIQFAGSYFDENGDYYHRGNVNIITPDGKEYGAGKG